MFHPDNETGFFFGQMEGIAPTHRRERLQAVAPEFAGSILTQVEIDDTTNDDFEKWADYLVANRTTLDPEAFYNSVKDITGVSPANIFALWNNLFYQVITHSSFYLKESIMKILIFQNLLDNIKGLDIDRAKELIPELASAHVVLPDVLFGQQKYMPSLTQHMFPIRRKKFVLKQLKMLKKNWNLCLQRLMK